jgi:hypothetical protein
MDEKICCFYKNTDKGLIETNLEYEDICKLGYKSRTRKRIGAFYTRENTFSKWLKKHKIPKEFDFIEANIDTVWQSGDAGFSCHNDTTYTIGIYGYKTKKKRGKKMTEREKELEELSNNVKKEIYKRLSSFKISQEQWASIQVAIELGIEKAYNKGYTKKHFPVEKLEKWLKKLIRPYEPYCTNQCKDEIFDKIKELKEDL